MTLYWNQLAASCEQQTGNSVTDQKIQEIDKQIENIDRKIVEQRGLVQRLAEDIRTVENKLKMDEVKFRNKQINQTQLDGTKTQVANAKENKETAKKELDRLSAEKLKLAREKNDLRITEQRTLFGDDFEYYDLMITANETEEDELSLETKAIAVAGMELECVVISDVVPASYDLFKAASNSYIAEEINAIAEFREISAQSQCGSMYDMGDREKQYESLIRAYNHKQNQLAAAERKLANAEMARDMYRPVYEETIKEFNDKEARIAEAEAWVEAAEARVKEAEAWVERAEERVAKAQEELEKAKSEKKKATSTRMIKYALMIAATIALAVCLMSGPGAATCSTPLKIALGVAIAVLLLWIMMEGKAQDNLEAAEAELKAALEELEAAEEELALAEQELEEALFELEMASLHTHMECRQNPQGSASVHPFHFDHQINDSILKVARSTKSEQTAKMAAADYLRMLGGARSSRPYDSNEPNLKELEKGLDSFGLMLRKKTVKSIKLASKFFFPEAEAKLVTMRTCDGDVKRCADGRELKRDVSNNCHFPRCNAGSNALDGSGGSNGSEDCPSDIRKCADGTYVSRDPGSLNKCSFDSCQSYNPSEDTQNDDRVTDTRVSRGFEDDGECSDTYNPVCAIPNTGDRDAPVQTFQNECLARKRSGSIQYYGVCSDGSVGNGTAQFVDDITKDLNLAVGTKSKDYFDKKKTEHINRQVVAWEVPKTRMEYMAEVVALFDSLANDQMPRIVAEAEGQVAELDALIKQFNIQTITKNPGYDSYDIPGTCYVKKNGDVDIDAKCECLKSNSCYSIKDPTASDDDDKDDKNEVVDGTTGVRASVVNSSGAFIVGISNALSRGNVQEARSQVELLQANQVQNATRFNNFLANASSNVKRAVNNANNKAKQKVDALNGNKRANKGSSSSTLIGMDGSSGRAVGSDFGGLFGGAGGREGLSDLSKNKPTEITETKFSEIGNFKPLDIGGKKNLEEKNSKDRSLASTKDEDSSNNPGYDPSTTIINKDRDASIFNVISNRYQKTAFPVLLRYVEKK
jgi:hypothetical protein